MPNVAESLTARSPAGELLTLEEATTASIQSGGGSRLAHLGVVGIEGEGRRPALQQSADGARTPLAEQVAGLVFSLAAVTPCRREVAEPADGPSHDA